MEFLTEDFIQENGLSEDQVNAIQSKGSDYIAEYKKEQDARVAEEANKHAEGIISGAAKKVQEVTGIEREQGEKIADYLDRSGTSYLHESKQSVENLKKEFEDKLKNTKGAEGLTAELEKYKSQVDEYQKKVAELEPNAEYKTKYDELFGQFQGMKVENAFNSIKPSFDKGSNPYEVKAKWGEFKKGVLDKYDIEIVDGEAIAVDKENKYKQTKLKELVSENKELQSLVNGRQQQGSGAIVKDEVEIEGVPFKVPKDADSKVKTQLVKEHLAKEGISVTSNEYPKKFSELYSKLKA